MKAFEERVSELFGYVEGLGAFTTGSHIVYTNGHHSRNHLNWGMVLEHPDIALIAAGLLGEVVDQYNFDTIVGPVHTGDKVARDLFFELNKRRIGLKCAYAEEEKVLRSVKFNKVWTKRKVDTGELFFPRRQELVVSGRKVLVVDDVVTTGGTVKKTIEAVQRVGGIVVASAVVYNIGTIDDSFADVPFLAMKRADMPFWEEDLCLPCQEGVPINIQVNKHGRDFLAKYGSDPKNWPANRRAA